MENKTTRKNRNETLEKLSAQGISLEELKRCAVSADPKPLWEQKKEEGRRKAEKKRKKKERQEAK